jgi:hypothetical protein
LDFLDKALYHQIHPAKLLTDWSTAFIAAGVLWSGHLLAGLLIGIVAAPIASALVMRFADLARLKDSAFGRYVARYMTPVAQALRVVGLIVFWVAAWWHSPAGLAVGLCIVVAAWGYGLALGG